ncbi:MAG: hypothetical protein BWY68_00640 [bacterium ADurb.Bin400]|nr:MAG: hypothetical protein BWY68_00640 [bacterium ADurb.Bin400]
MVADLHDQQAEIGSLLCLVRKTEGCDYAAKGGFSELVDLTVDSQISVVNTQEVARLLEVGGEGVQMTFVAEGFPGHSLPGFFWLDEEKHRYLHALDSKIFITDIVNNVNNMEGFVI